MVVRRDLWLQWHCEHHVVPITGKVHVAYLQVYWPDTATSRPTG